MHLYIFMKNDLKNFYEKTGMDRRHLAYLLNVSPSMIKRYERKKFKAGDPRYYLDCSIQAIEESGLKFWDVDDKLSTVKLSLYWRLNEIKYKMRRKK